ncbi:MAG: hypothetical protein QW400_02720 [Candidatus Diapherotrites archaeon]
MMEFTLSKINLLILAIALFAIIVGFAFSFRSTLLYDISKNIANSSAETISRVVSQKALCDSQEIAFRRKYSFYNLMDFYYVVELRKETSSGANKQHLIIAILERNEYLKRRGTPTVVSSSQLDLDAELQIFSYDQKEALLCPTERTVLDVRSAPIPIDQLTAVHEIYKGKSYLYLIPCSTTAKGICEQNKQLVGCYLYRKRKDISNCFNVDIADCESRSVPTCWGV